MYSNFVFLDRFLFELSCKNTYTHKQTRKHTHTDSNEYPIVAFSKNATITSRVYFAFAKKQILYKFEGQFDLAGQGKGHKFMK